MRDTVVAERQASAGARDGVKGNRRSPAARAPLHALVRRGQQTVLTVVTLEGPHERERMRASFGVRTRFAKVGINKGSADRWFPTIDRFETECPDIAMLQAFNRPMVDFDPSDPELHSVIIGQRQVVADTDRFATAAAGDLDEPVAKPDRGLNREQLRHGVWGKRRTPASAGARNGVKGKGTISLRALRCMRKLGCCQTTRSHAWDQFERSSSERLRLSSASEPSDSCEVAKGKARGAKRRRKCD